MSRIDLGKVVGEVNPKTQIPYELAESYQVPMSGDPMDVFMGKVTTDLGIHDSAIGRSDAYSDEVDYAANEYCIKDNMVYRFTEDKPMGPWDETKAVATNIITELLDMRRSLIELNSKQTLRYVDGEPIRNFTISNVGSNNFYDSQIPGTRDYLFATVCGLGTVSGSVSVGGSGRIFYVIGNPGSTVALLNVRYWYFE